MLAGVLAVAIAGGAIEADTRWVADVVRADPSEFQCVADRQTALRETFFPAEGEPPAGGAPTLDVGPTGLAARAAEAAQSVAAPSARPLAFEYSEGYRVRRKIHRYASFATLPLFAAQFAVGQKLYDQRDNASDGLRSAHGALAAGTGALFAVNTVTGVWNMSEGRRDPSHRNKRRLHALLMLTADAGFVATGLLAPESEDEGRPTGTNDGRRSTHRTVALTSMGIATVGYLIMLFDR